MSEWERVKWEKWSEKSVNLSARWKLNNFYSNENMIIALCNGDKRQAFSKIYFSIRLKIFRARRRLNHREFLSLCIPPPVMFYWYYPLVHQTNSYGPTNVVFRRRHSLSFHMLGSNDILSRIVCPEQIQYSHFGDIFP